MKPALTSLSFWTALLLTWSAICACATTDEEINRIEEFRNRATQYYDAGDLARAEQQARRGLALDPDHGTLNLILGRTLLGKRDLRSVADARSFLEKSYDELSDWRSALSLGECHLRYAEFLLGEANLLERRLREEGALSEVDLKDMEARTEQTQTRAREYLAKSRPLLEESNRINEGYTFCLQLLASCYSHQGHDDLALKTLEELIDTLQESRNWKSGQLALQELELWQEDQIRDGLRNDLNLLIESRGLAATLLMQDNQYADAERQLTEVLKLNQDLDREYYNRGLCRYHQGRLADAAADMQVFIRKTSLPYETSPEVKRALDIIAEHGAHSRGAESLADSQF